MFKSFVIGKKVDKHQKETMVNQDKTYIFYCASGGRSALAAKVAINMGLSPVVNLTGGIAAWAAAGGAVE